MNIYKITKFRDLETKLETLSTEFICSNLNEDELLNMIHEKTKDGLLLKYSKDMECYLDKNVEWYPCISDNKKFMKQYGDKQIIFNHEKKYGSHIIISECLIKSNVTTFDYTDLIKYGVLKEI